jgi:hypothetical protein
MYVNMSLLYEYDNLDFIKEARNCLYNTIHVLWIRPCVKMSEFVYHIFTTRPGISVNPSEPSLELSRDLLFFKKLGSI